MATGKISILSPMYTEDERWVANVIKMELELGKQRYTTYHPYIDGLERQLFEFLSRGDDSAVASEAKRAILLSSALNYYSLIKASDACVLVLDGRAPDEGSVFWAAVAFASGKPVILYKSDYRTFMSTGDNSMVTGLCLDYKPVRDIKSLSDSIASRIARYNEDNLWKREHIPGYNRSLQALGEKVWTACPGRSLKAILNEMKGDTLLENLLPHDESEYKLSGIREAKVYCSGPLFCPAEIREISKIAKYIECAGLTTYLPHRDGVEAMMGELDNAAGRLMAAKDNYADVNSFTIDVFQLVECKYFVINLNGRAPDDGAVAEAGMAFAMGRPIVLYRSEPRTFCGGVRGFVHPALQMAGHLFDTTADCSAIHDKLAGQAAFIKIKNNGHTYSPEIHPEVKTVHSLGRQYYTELNETYSGPVLELNRFFFWRIAHLGADRAYHPYSTWMQVGMVPNFPRFLTDLTGNGCADMVGFANDGTVVAFNKGNGTFQSPQKVVGAFGGNDGWGVESTPRFLADLTGDGRADIVGFAFGDVEIALNKGNGTFQPPQSVVRAFGYNDGWRVESTPRFLADLTGDGRADIVGFSLGEVEVALNKGNGTFQPPQSVLPAFCYNHGWSMEKNPRFLVDLTGDRCADIIGFGDDGVWVALNKGGAAFQKPELALRAFGYNAGWCVEKTPRFLADLRGNRRADIVGFGDDGVWVALNNGDGTFQTPQKVLDGAFGYNVGWRVEKNPRFLADLTGDGRSDIIGFSDDGVWVALNNGNGTFQSPKMVLAGAFGRNAGWLVEKHPRFLADLTGDGCADIIGFSDDGGWVIALNNGDGTFHAPKVHPGCC